jgi:hypothetical protein
MPSHRIIIAVARIIKKGKEESNLFMVGLMGEANDGSAVGSKLTKSW